MWLTRTKGKPQQQEVNTPDSLDSLKEELRKDIEKLQTDSVPEVLKLVLKRTDQVYLTLIKKISDDYNEAVESLDKIRKRYEIAKLVKDGFLIFIIIAATYLLIYLGIIRLCSLESPEIPWLKIKAVMTTNNCASLP